MSEPVTDIPEETVQFFLFPPPQENASNLSNEETLAWLSSEKWSYLQALHSYLDKYIWHNESFHLEPRLGSKDIPAHLFGSVNFGEIIDDEWFIVFLLRQLTSSFPGLVVSVLDADGEFLLAEVAELLPKLLQPDTAINRVFLVEGKLYVIPIAESPAHLTPLPSKTTPTVSQAVHIARNFTQVNMVNEQCQEQLQERLEKFEGNLEQLLQRTKCYIPWACAHALKRCPSLVSAAIQAFHQHRDQQGTTLSAMRKFPPESRVWARITMSRGQYALLKATTYAPPRIVGWNVPASNHPTFKGFDLGMKLACGFEILAAQAQKQVNVPCLEENVQWQRYLASLEKRGYFQDFLAQSEPYIALWEQAKEFFLQHVDWKEGSRPAHAQKLLALLEEEVDGSVYEREGKNDTTPDDDDSWLTLSPEGLDELLERQFNLKSGENTALLPNLEEFLKYEAGAEGAEPRKVSRGRKRSTQAHSSRKVSTLSNFSTVSEASTNIGFDPESFGKALEGILDCHVPEDDFSDSDTGMSSYGEDEEEDELPPGSLKEYMDAMDQELEGTQVKTIPKAHKSSSESSLDDVESFEPVNINGAALGNLLAAYQAQRGRPGPASSLLSHLKENETE